MNRAEVAKDQRSTGVPLRINNQGPMCVCVCGRLLVVARFTDFFPPIRWAPAEAGRTMENSFEKRLAREGGGGGGAAAAAAAAQGGNDETSQRVRCSRARFSGRQ